MSKMEVHEKAHRKIFAAKKMEKFYEEVTTSIKYDVCPLCGMDLRPLTICPSHGSLSLLYNMAAKREDLTGIWGQLSKLE
ncbi:MAG: hypothetical protein PVG39_07880 [Desulfobacteraceae bacterium]|jgi:hypothetical protein